jgi:hypothetical protein
MDQQARRLDYVIDQNDDLLDRMDDLHMHAEAISPIATSLTNRISTVSDEHLLLYADDDDESITQIVIHAVNTRTMKKRGYKSEDAIAYVTGGNMVNAQNELFKLVIDHGLNIGKINRRSKTFVINRSDVDRLQNLIESKLNKRINREQTAISETTQKIASTANKRTKPPKLYMGFDIGYCKSVCLKWNIDKALLTEIINGDWSTGDGKPIILHKTKGLVYESIRHGKTIYKPLPVDTFTEDE